MSFSRMPPAPLCGLSKDKEICGLYDDNHRLADEALKWVVEPALAAGLRLREGASLEPADAPIGRRRGPLPHRPELGSSASR